MSKNDKVGLKSRAKVKRKSIALTDDAFASIDLAEKRMKANKDLTGSVADRLSKAASKAIVSEMTKMISEINEVEGLQSTTSTNDSTLSYADSLTGHQEKYT